MSNEVNLKEFVTGFVLEADEHLHSVNRNLVTTSEALKEGRPEPRAVRELFRSLHTIKGLAAMVSADPVVDIAHEMENILRAADRAGGRISEQSLDLILQGTRALEERIHAISKNGVAGAAPASKQLLEALSLSQESLIKTETKEEFDFSLPPEILKSLSVSDREQLIQGVRVGRNAIRIEFQPSAKKAALGLNITTIRERIGKVGALVKVVPLSSSSAPTGISFSLILVTASELDELSAVVGVSEEHIHKILTSQKPAVTEASVPNAPEPVADWMPADHSSIRVDIRRA